jgi:hypothetical protein
MTKPIPDNEQLRTALHGILHRANLLVSTKRTIRSELETTLLLQGGSLDHRKKEIGKWIDADLQECKKEAQNSSADESIETEMKPPPLIPALADFVGTNQMAISDVARKIWEHILSNKLQVIWANCSVILPRRGSGVVFHRERHPR